MDKKIAFRELTPEDIEVRVATVKDGKATLLCYIDSRSVVELMDEAVGPMNWNMEFEEVGGRIVGKMGVWDEDKGVWVVKSDTGSESNIEAEKGLFSDVYKRCIARWGLQDLYTCPRIVVADNGYGNRYSVGDVAWNDRRECTSLTLVDKWGKTVWTWSKDATVERGVDIRMTAQKDDKETLREFCRERMKAEPDRKDDIIKFGQYYASKLDTWEGAFDAAKLYSGWSSRRG